jgi:hypothetical protein
MSFIRKIKKGNSIYLAEVENYRQDGKVRQRVIRYIGKEVDGKAVKKVETFNIEVSSVKQYLDYKILHDISVQLGLPDVLGKDMKHILLLVYTQLVSHKSLYKLPEYVEHTVLQELLGFDKLIDKHLYQALDSLEELDFGRVEETVLSALLSGKRDKKALVLDVTDTYFSGSQADWKARRGKDGKYGHLLQIALAVTKDEGFPIMHKSYEGNISNINIFKDMLVDTKLKNFDITILDRGMISYESIVDLQTIRQKVITGLRMNDKLCRDYLSSIDRETIYSPNACVKLKHTTVYCQSFDFMDGKLIAVYNPTIEVHKRDAAMECPEKYNPKRAKYMGYSLIFHTSTLPDDEVVRTYFEKDIVEKAYREIKSSINLNPVRKYRIDRVKAHVKICYMAYAILAYMQQKLKPLKISAVEALNKLQYAYEVELFSKQDNFRWSKTVTISKIQANIIKALRCSV